MENNEPTITLLGGQTITIREYLRKVIDHAERIETHEKNEKAITIIKKKRVNVFSEIVLNQDYSMYLDYMENTYNYDTNDDKFVLTKDEWQLLKEVFDNEHK